MNADVQDFLKLSWRRVCSNIGAFGDINKVFDEITKKYTKEGRYYHNLNYISRCLEEFCTIRHLAKDPNAVELAIWVHSFYCDPKRTEKFNKKQSAVYAKRICQTLHLSRDFEKHVANLVMATRYTEGAWEVETDGWLISDVIFSQLGSPPEEFDWTMQQIRKEYSHLTNDKEFVESRAVLFVPILTRHNIFHTGEFRRKYEGQARENLSRYVFNAYQQYSGMV